LPLELDESGVLPLEFEVLPVDPDPDVPEAPVLDPVVPVLPVLPDIPDDEEPEPAAESELPDPSVLVLPEGEREVLLLLRPCALPELLDVLDPVLLPVSAVDEVSDPEVPRELPELPWDRSDPCDAVSDDDPEPDEPEPVDDCPLVPEPVPEPDDCATAAPAIASAPAPINVPNQRLSLIRRYSCANPPGLQPARPCGNHNPLRSG
jgi:hypothetical protein